MDAFDFDAWAELAQRDPRAFQQEREKALRKAVQSAPEHLRARLDRLVDELCQAPQSDGLSAAVASHNLLMASFGQLQGAWAHLHQVAGQGDIRLPNAALEFTELRVEPPRA